MHPSSQPASSRKAQLEKLLALDPNDPFVLYALAQEHAKLGEVDHAVALYDRCLASDPSYHYAYYHKAKSLVDADRTPEAVVTLNLGIAAARAARDAKALSELEALLDQLA